MPSFGPYAAGRRSWRCNARARLLKGMLRRRSKDQPVPATLPCQKQMNGLFPQSEVKGVTGRLVRGLLVSVFVLEQAETVGGQAGGTGSEPFFTWLSHKQHQVTTSRLSAVSTCQNWCLLSRYCKNAHPGPCVNAHIINAAAVASRACHHVHGALGGSRLHTPVI